LVYPQGWCDFIGQNSAFTGPKLLLNTINNGGAKLGGWVPAFKDKLTDKEKLL
jgi:hypothetical protein